MGKGKLAKFADMEANPLVVECPYWLLKRDGFALKGRWHTDFFKNDNPIVLELGCGRGEYTVGLARECKDKNFIGVDIKGSRMWHGAQTALREGMTNAAFLRTNIEFIHEMFDAGEVSEIWLTFSDPQMKKPTKRLTSTYFMERYRHFLVDGGKIHLKTDSNFMATYTRLMAEHNSLPILQRIDDLYAGFTTSDPAISDEGCAQQTADKQSDTKDSALTSIRTYYEQMWLDRGLAIKYLCFTLPHAAVLSEPDVEIPVDGYRSYDHAVVSTVKTRK